MSLNAVSYAGLPYEDINWYDVIGQPFGIASYFNAIVLGDANNIVDTSGAMAVGGNFVSPRGLSVAYGNDLRLTGTGYSPDFVRFMVGGNIAMQGPLVVIGHVVGGGNFRAASGSTYMIGKDGSPDQIQELSQLYQVAGGSQYWRPSDRGTHYAISSYDAPRFIPAGRIGADIARFFADARESLFFYHDCISSMTPNGTVVDHFHEKILRGNDPVQNLFVIDARPNGILDKELRFETPAGSVNIVVFRTGPNAHLQYGLWGAENLATRTLYVFEDATNIHMEVPADIWGSILAPQAMFHGHRTGGHVSGNVALGSFAVNANSGFEFHLFPFVGGIACEELLPEAPELPEEIPVPVPIPECPPCPPQAECPPQVECPPPQVCPECPPAPPCPVPLPCPEPPPCPTCPQPAPCPTCPECLAPLPCPECPTCPTCPTCPECLAPAPCPVCPPCPDCPEAETRIEYVPYPVRVPMPCPGIRVRMEYRQVITPAPTPCKDSCKIKPGVILGCIWGCCCHGSHEFEVKLYKICDEKKIQVYCERVGCCSCFEIKVPYDNCYLLELCAIGVKKGSGCKPMLTLKNVGVSSLMIDA